MLYQRAQANWIHSDCCHRFNMMPDTTSCSKYLLGAFFPTASNVGLTEYEGAFVCSISNDFLYDNCERLLLPDDCWYNGTCSSAPFAERMNSVCDIVRYAADCSGEVELFIGDCGQCPLTEKALFPKQYDALSHELPDVSTKFQKVKPAGGHFCPPAGHYIRWCFRLRCRR